MGTAKDVYEIIKDIGKFAKEASNTPFYDKVIEIQAAFFDMKEEIYSLKEENSRLKKNIEDLENQKKEDISNDIIFSKYGYFTRKSEGENPKNKYCSNCYSVKKLIIPVADEIGSYYFCPNCKNKYRKN